MSQQQRQQLTLSPLMNSPLTLAHSLLSLSGETMAGIGTGPAPALVFGGPLPPVQNPWSRRQRSMRRQVVSKPHNLQLQLNLFQFGGNSPSPQSGPAPRLGYAATQHSGQQSQTSGSSWALAAFGGPGTAITPTVLHPGYPRLELASPLTTSNSSYQLLVPERSRMRLSFYLNFLCISNQKM